MSVPRRPVLSIAAARRCDPWYRVAMMASKLRDALDLLPTPPREATGPHAALVHHAEGAMLNAGACVAAVEALELARRDAPEPEPAA